MVKKEQLVLNGKEEEESWPLQVSLEHTLPFGSSNIVAFAQLISSTHEMQL